MPKTLELYKIVGPLRKIGIPAAAIADLDFLGNPTGDWENILNACQVDKGLWAQIETDRKIITASVSHDALKQNGINDLNPTEKTKAEFLLQALGKYGLFLVHVGELECWLKKIGATGHGPNWLIDVFAKIGSTDNDKNYIKPEAGDVWLFLENVEKYIVSKLLAT
jgi:hypothetical protein